jgi:SAM-dependent methyltransferase
MSELTPHAQKNRDQWNEWAADYVAEGRRSWSLDHPISGIWRIPDSSVGALGDMSRFKSLDVLELGCGTAYFGAWFAKAGARVHGIDNSPEQLKTAHALQEEFGLEFPLQLGTAEDLPFEDQSFDVAFSEYGASIWCDPYLWIPEAARVLRPGGELIFLANSVLSILCAPDDDGPTTTELKRPQLGLHKLEWPDDPTDNSVEFHLPHGQLIDLFNDCGLQVQRLIELHAPVGATTRYQFVTPEWAQQWPSEEIWIARKKA